VFYVEYTHGALYRSAAHTEYICEHLDSVERGEIDRLMIFVPPRHSKSMTATETFPSYFIGKDPNRRVIEVSYGEDLARKFGKRNKQKVEAVGEELFGITIDRSTSSNTAWDIAGHRGGMISVGIGGGITGQGADLLMIDDPIKNRQQADSQTYRDMLWSEWQDTLQTRLHPGGRIVIILTRWHEDDLAGRILSNPEEAAQWTIVNLPCVAEEDDPLGRKPGELLWPEHGFDEKWAARKKKSVGPRTWASLYQQRPAPAEGQILKRKWWKYYTVRPSKFDEIILSWDMTFKDKKESDYVVGQAWGRKGADKYLLDQVRAKMDFPTTVQTFVSFSAKFPRAKAKLVEDKANGPAVISTLKGKVPGIIAVNPEGGKIARAEAASVDAEAGNVYLPDPSIAPWVHDFVEECAAFPNGKNDDQVDGFSQAMARFASKQKVVLSKISKI
jgi:predicted phage terminase large subunit-like protein